MSQIILDMGSGNTCKNSMDYVEAMIDAVASIDNRKHGHEIVFKWQLFQHEPPNIPLSHDVFAKAYVYAKTKGYRTTSSVFDMPSLEFLLAFDVPFVKIAARPRIYWLLDKIPRGIPVYLSYANSNDLPKHAVMCEELMFCVPKYPAPLEDYENSDEIMSSHLAISDHTQGLELWKTWKPTIWEKHFILDDDPSNPDAAGHAMKPEQLKEIIGA